MVDSLAFHHCRPSSNPVSTTCKFCYRSKNPTFHFSSPERMLPLKNLKGGLRSVSLVTDLNPPVKVLRGHFPLGPPFRFFFFLLIVSGIHHVVHLCSPVEHKWTQMLLLRMPRIATSTACNNNNKKNYTIRKSYF